MPKPPPLPNGINSPSSLAVDRLSMANFLTLVLRDDPKAIGLYLDSQGWANIDHLLARTSRYGFMITRETLTDIIAASSKPHFEWDQPGNRIRAVRN